jgi:hypothetical protein
MTGGVGQRGDAVGPGALRLWEQRVNVRADPGVQDSGDIPDTCQVAGGDGRMEELGGVQAGQFGGAQGAE